MTGRWMGAAAMAVAVVIAVGAVPDIGIRQAQASCITWNGGQVCDAPTSRPTWHAPSRTYRGGGVRYYGGGGGGGRAAAAIGAAGAAIGLLGMMIDAAEQAEAAQQNAANEAARRRWAACQARYKRAHAMNEDARRMITDGEADEAFAKFEQAMAALGDCAAGSDMAKLRNNLDVARKEYAALTNPSGGQVYGDGARQSALPYPGELEARATAACSHVAQGSAGWQACVQNREAEGIMFADNAIRDRCQSIADIEARNSCVFNRYGAALTGQDPDKVADDNCYRDEHGKPCHPGGGAAATRSPGRDADSDPNSLRNQLRRSLADKSDADTRVQDARAAEIARAKALRDSLPEGSPDRKALDDVIAKAEAGQAPQVQPPAQAASAPVPAPTQQAAAPEAPAPSNGPGKSLNDQSYDNYMSSDTANSGGKNSGDLGHSGFSMSGSETRREMDRLEGK